MQILQNIHSIFATMAQQEHNVIDNACGAVARIMYAHCNKIPLEQIFPNFLAALPLREDYQENEPVFNCILFLFGSGNAVAGKYIKQIFSLFGRVIGPRAVGGVNSTLQAQIIQQLQQFKMVFADQFSQVVNSLTADEKQAILSSLQ